MGYEDWDEAYRSEAQLPWELGEPRKQLIGAVEGGWVRRGKALDICCGLGTNTVYLAKKGFQVKGIDISQTAVEGAKEKAGKAGVNIDFRVGSAVRLPYPANEFVFVFDMGCFHHILPRDRDAYLEGVRRVLKRGGKYLGICFSRRNGPAWNHFTEEELKRIFSPYFGIEKIEHFSNVEGDGVRRYFYSIFMKK
jgi:ubiquinone/menaquinone biosynthesis C-methylase UbiE